MGDGNDNANTKKQKSKWTTSYCTMTMEQSEPRLGLRIFELLKKAKPVEKVLCLSELEVKYNL